MVDVILVPQGIEYQTVRSGLGRIRGKVPVVVPIPVGGSAVKSYLQGWLQGVLFSDERQMQVVVVGLAGSLSPRHRVGDVVLYRDCTVLKPQEQTLNKDLTEQKTQDSEHPVIFACDHSLTQLLQRRLDRNSAIVNALTSDRVIHVAEEKQTLAEVYEAEVVDMEGSAILETLSTHQVAVAMLRVISDDCHHDLPDLTAAIRSDGTLHPARMAIVMMRQPIAALRLIRGAWQGLRVLREVTQAVFGE